MRPGFVAVWFEGEEASAALMCERLVFTLEVWVGGDGGRAGAGGRRTRGCRASSGPRCRFERLAKRIRDRGAFDDAFVDALCEPPQSFTYGGVLAHVLSYGAVRREALASVLAELGAEVPSMRRSDPVGGRSERADPDGPERDDVLRAAVRL